MAQHPFDFVSPAAGQALPVVNEPSPPPVRSLGDQVREACQAWLMKSPSRDTRSNYQRDLVQFLTYAGVPADRPEALTAIRPQQVAAWRDHLQAQGLTNSSIRRKMTVLRALFSYLQSYGYVGANPAH